MKMNKTPIPGAFTVELGHFPDDRGFLDVIFSRDELAKADLAFPVAQSMASWNRKRGTLRGMHYQEKPRTEVKLVTCVLGAIYDVIVDLRRDSPTHKKWFAVELAAANHLALYIPEGLAHGYQTLVDDSYVLYHTSQPYEGTLARGVAWNDPAFHIQWPEVTHRLLSPRDQQHPPYAG